MEWEGQQQMKIQVIIIGYTKALENINKYMRKRLRRPSRDGC